MTFTKNLFLLSLFALGISPVYAKHTKAKNAAKLVCDYKKAGNENEYELVFHMTLEKGWFVKADNDYDSVRMKLPKFTYEKSDKYSTIGETVSKGLIEPKKLRRVGIVNMYSYTVLYSQRVTAQPGAVIKGAYTYQVCNDKAAKRTRTENFSIKIKETPTAPADTQ